MGYGLSRTHAPTLSAIRRAPTCPFPYTEALKVLTRFRRFWTLQDGLGNHTREPVVVWIIHPESHTKPGPAHIFAQGFCPTHTLFLETRWPLRALPPLMSPDAQVHAFVLDGFPCTRPLLQLARCWLKPRTLRANTVLRADALAALWEGAPTPGTTPTQDPLRGDDVLPRLFVLGQNPCPKGGFPS
jgi:hypothetical protein